MAKTRTIKFERYPAARLPDDLMDGIDPAGEVTVTIDQQNDVPEAEVPKYLRYWGIAAHKTTSIEEAVARIRHLRDEWD